MPVPTLTTEQRALARERSLELRRTRADIKAWIGEAESAMRLALAWQFPAAQGMKVYDLLRAVPSLGHAKATALLASARINERRTVKATGDRQRDRLFEALIEKLHLDD